LIKKFKNNFHSLDLKIKNILFIVYVYMISSIFISNFLGIILYKQKENLEDLLTYYIFNISFGGSAILLSIYLFPLFKVNLKNILKIGFLTIFLSFSYLIFHTLDNNLLNINFNLFIAINAIGNSIYWYGLNLFELKHTKSKERMLYISFSQLGRQIINIFIPLIISLLIILSNKYFNSEYTITIFLLTFSILIILYKCNKIENYFPKKIKHINFNKKNNILFLYNLINGFNYINFIIVYIYLTSITFNKLENIGFYQFIVNLISILLIIRLTNNIDKNKIKIMFKYFLITILSIIPLLYEINLYTYIFFTIIFSISYPIYLIFSKSISLKSTELISSNKTNSLFIKELFLNIGRILSLILIYIIYFIVSKEYFIPVLIIYILLLFIIEFLIIKKIINY